VGLCRGAGGERIRDRGDLLRRRYTKLFDDFAKTVGDFAALNDTPLAGAIADGFKRGELVRDPRPGFSAEYIPASPANTHRPSRQARGSSLIRVTVVTSDQVRGQAWRSPGTASTVFLTIEQRPSRRNELKQDIVVADIRGQHHQAVLPRLRK
jgi:hypothetical protein